MGWITRLRRGLDRASAPKPQVEDGRAPDLDPDELGQLEPFHPLGGRQKLRPVKGKGSKYTEMPRNADDSGKWWTGGTGV
jgi:hypothetical protein